MATCDAQVEDTHFRLRRTSSHDIGRRALVVNLSDIAAMGARPRFALISLLVPPALDVAILDGIYAGLREEATQFDVALVGGNIARNAERLIIDITLLGTGTRNKLLRRDTAKAGEAVMVTGSLGSAAAGLLVSEDEQLAAKVAPENLAGVLAALRTPTPRVVAGQWLAQHSVTTGIDVSDGLAADISHICEASGVGVQIEAEALPIRPEVVRIADLAGREPQDLALFGGEDYELVFTVPADHADMLARELFVATGVSAGYAGDLKGPPNPSQPPSPLRIARLPTALPGLARCVLARTAFIVPRTRLPLPLLCLPNRCCCQGVDVFSLLWRLYPSPPHVFERSYLTKAIRLYQR